MDLHRRQFLALGTAASAGPCTITPPPVTPVKSLVPRAPLKISENRLTHITVCTRPFRPAGPRIEAERFGEKTVIHNYGHGGSGWSLSWGCADAAVALAKATQARTFAVIGAGVIGLTTALRLVQLGVDVTIYAKDLPRETRSARATGVWSPSSRIGLHSAVPGGFGDTWEAWTRSAYKTHLQFVGSVGRPIEYVPFYQLRSNEPREPVPETRDFLHLWSRIRDLGPSGKTLTDDAHRFPVASAREGAGIAINISAYTDRIVRDFLAHGGRLIRKDFPDRATALSLPEPVIMNCTGYGAKTLWGAEDLVPVRGQINWLPPQPEARYGLVYNDAYVLSRGDGLILQNIGPNDDFGYGVEDETPDLDEMRATLGIVAPLFEGWT